MPQEVKACYNEAREVYPISPRSAAALLRLALQNLLNIGEKGNIDSAIQKLVDDGQIEAHAQQAMDAVRLLGNSAVHGGFMNLNDQPETALALFDLLNIVVEETIGKENRKNQVAKVYAVLPEDKRKAIEKRGKK